MNWKNFLCGIAVGVTVGFLVSKTMDRGKLTSEEVLSRMKNELRKTGKITGSWILTKPENFQKNNIDYMVYRGGITRLENGETSSYEFLADVHSGTIIEIDKLTT